jgi:hypothetical protein
LHIDGGDYQFDITRWYDHEGNEHDGDPTDQQLLEDAERLTGKLTYSDGSTVHYTIHSPDGWLEDELRASVDDAAGYYEEYAA